MSSSWLSSPSRSWRFGVLATANLRVVSFSSPLSALLRRAFLFCALPPAGGRGARCKKAACVPGAGGARHDPLLYCCRAGTSAPAALQILSSVSMEACRFPASTLCRCVCETRARRASWRSVKWPHAMRWRTAPRAASRRALKLVCMSSPRKGLRGRWRRHRCLLPRRPAG